MDGPIGLVDVGPYRATRLWLDLVQMFVTGMPLKRHWRNFKVVENCFTGREAVKWFHGALLQSTKASKLDCFTRSQTITLLDKFYHSGVFTSVTSNYVAKFRVTSMDLYTLSAEAMNGGTLQLPFGQNIQNPHRRNNADDESKENNISTSNVKAVHISGTNPEVDANIPHIAWTRPNLHHNQGAVKKPWNTLNTHPSCLPIIKGAKPKVLGVLSPRNPPVSCKGNKGSPRPVRTSRYPEGRQRMTARSPAEGGPSYYRSCSAGPIPTRDRYGERPIENQKGEQGTGMQRMQSESRIGPGSLERIGRPQHHHHVHMHSGMDIKTDVAMHVSLASKSYREDAGFVLRQKSLQASVEALETSHWRNTTGSSQSHSHKLASFQDMQALNFINQQNTDESEKSRDNYQHSSPIPQSLSVQGTSLSESTRNIARSAISLVPSLSIQSTLSHATNSQNLTANNDPPGVKDTDEEFLDVAWKNAFRSRILTLFPGSLLPSLMPSQMPASWVKPGDEIRGNFVTLLETLFDVQRQGNGSCPDELSDKLCKSVIAHFMALARFYSFGPDMYHLLHQGFIILQHMDEKTYQLKINNPCLYPKKLPIVCAPNNFASRRNNNVNALPPNACFETEFLSASPVTRIIAVTSHCRDATKKTSLNFEDDMQRKSMAPSLRRRHSLHRSSSTRNRCGDVDRLRNTSGGYINPALETDSDVIPDLDYVAAMSCLQKLMECSRKNNMKKLDMALLGQCRRWDLREMEEKDVFFESKDISGEDPNEQSFAGQKKWDSHDYVNVGVCLSEAGSGRSAGSEGSDGYDGGDSGTESEGASFHTAVSSPTGNASRQSDGGDDWLGHVDATAAEFLRLALLCLEPQRRSHLKQLLLALKVISPSTKSLVKIVDVLSTTLTTYSSSLVDIDFMKRLLNFLVAHQSVLFEIPQGLLEQIKHSANFLKRQQAPSTMSLPDNTVSQLGPNTGFVNHQHSTASTLSLPQGLMPPVESSLAATYRNQKQVKASTASLPARLALNNSEGQLSYCTQVSTEEFEQQKLTVSQMAIAELLEQLLSDCKMSVKEKKKRLKTFKESYPHIYYRRFPIPERMEKKRLLQPVLTKFKSMRI